VLTLYLRCFSPPVGVREGGGVQNDIEDEKRLAATAAAALVEDGMAVGLGTGSTVAYLIPALAARLLAVSCVATSPATETLALAHGLRMEPFAGVNHLSIAIDGADQVDPDGWLVKGGGGAQTREKIVAAAADQFVVIVSSDKPVDALHPPVPLELMSFGLDTVLRQWPDVRLRDAPATPDGGVLADYFGALGDPAVLSARLAATPGVVSHGLFPPSMANLILVGRGDQVVSVTPSGTGG
jgi:ribose 5-phosphate isomerase A